MGPPLDDGCDSSDLWIYNDAACTDDGAENVRACIRGEGELNLGTVDFQYCAYSGIIYYCGFRHDWYESTGGGVSYIAAYIPGGTDGDFIDNMAHYTDFYNTNRVCTSNSAPQEFVDIF